MAPKQLQRRTVGSRKVFMKSVIFSLVFGSLLMTSAAHAIFFNTTSTRNVQCNTRTGNTKFCVGNVAYRCEYSNYSCVSLKISQIQQTVSWTLFGGERITGEYAIPTDRKKHGAKLYIGSLSKTKKQCEQYCQEPDYSNDDDYSSPPSDNGNDSPSSPSAPTNTCSGTIWCSGLDHCVNGQCVSRDAFHQCDAFNTCALGESCNNGVCGN